MEKKEFKAESKRLLEMMINSIYTHREIFLRELISNSSDAIDKLYFKSLTDDKVGLNKDDFAIKIRANKDDRTITITDNGIGMTKEELENNLGTIAKSGSLAFKSENQLGEDVDIIGQFGVGFYSAFMVAKMVTVKSRAYGSDEAYLWQSEGVDGYTIETDDKETVGTEITLYIKDNTEDENYDEYLDTYTLEELIKKYSDYIRFPIQLEKTTTQPKEDNPDETETIVENETVNSMIPIWKKNKSELTDEDYEKFYMSKFNEFEKPLTHIHIKTEGTATYNAILYIPKRPAYDYYSKDFEKGLQLYSNGVLIMDKCGDLLPDYFSFVKGIVDSEDLSLNISREMLQHDRQLKLIAKNIEKTIKNELTKMLNNNREQYEEFFRQFGMQIKAGIYNNFMGDIRNSLQDLVLFHSLKENKPITFDEYVTAMSDEQKYIFYATGESVSKIEQLPQADLIKDKGWDILCCTERIDEFTLKMLMSYKDKQFKSISDDDLDIETPEEKEDIKTKSEDSKELFKYMQETLNGKVAEVKLSSRLKNHPVCLTSKGPISIEMEKTLNSMPSQQRVNAERVLEINPEHGVFQSISNAFASGDKDKVAKYTNLLYTQALLIEGLSIENPVEFSNLICELMK